jgi:hypothetical protein
LRSTFRPTARSFDIARIIRSGRTCTPPAADVRGGVLP